MSTKLWLHVAGLVVVGWLLGVVHGVLSEIIPSIKLDVLLLVGMVGALAMVIRGFGEIAFEEDRPKALPLYGIGLGVVAVMGSWCGWVWSASEWGHFMLLHPIELVQIVHEVAEHGQYTATSGGGTSVGVGQASVRWAWICEALTVGLTPVLSAVFWVFGRQEEW